MLLYQNYTKLYLSSLPALQKSKYGPYGELLAENILMKRVKMYDFNVSGQNSKF